MALKIIFDNLNKQRFPKIPQGMVNPGVDPRDITKLLELADGLWHCHGLGSTQRHTPDRQGLAYLEWHYLSKIVPFSEYEGETFQSNKPWFKSMRGSMFTIGRTPYVFTGTEAMVFNCYIPPEHPGNEGVDPDFEWLYGIPSEAKVWCPRCSQVTPFTNECVHIWERGIMMGPLHGYENNQHRPFERQEDGFTWVLPGTPPYPDIPELTPMTGPREQRPAVVKDGLQLSLF